MREVHSGSTSAGRNPMRKIARARSRAASCARRKYNAMRARNSRWVGALQDLSGRKEEEVMSHLWMKSDLDSKILKISKKPTYVQVKDMIERKLAHQKKACLQMTKS